MFGWGTNRCRLVPNLAGKIEGRRSGVCVEERCLVKSMYYPNRVVLHLLVHRLVNDGLDRCKMSLSHHRDVHLACICRRRLSLAGRVESQVLSLCWSDHLGEAHREDDSGDLQSEEGKTENDGDENANDASLHDLDDNNGHGEKWLTAETRISTCWVFPERGLPFLSSITELWWVGVRWVKMNPKTTTKEIKVRTRNTMLKT